MEARDISPSSPEPFQISLRVRHPTIDPVLISRELKVEPEHCFRAGEPRESSSGIAAAAVHGESYWLGSLQTLPAVAPLAGFTIRARVLRWIVFRLPHCSRCRQRSMRRSSRFCASMGSSFAGCRTSRRSSRC